MEDFLTRLRHSASHILAQAVAELFPGTKLGFGPAIEDGFYYDFDCPFTLNEETFSKIQEKMQEIIDSDLKFEREDIPKDAAIDYFSKKGETYKVELIRDLEETDTVSLYRHDNFVDLCKGPHLNSTGDVKKFKLLRVAGAYWRGDE
ncbi:threonine--tRNA ligase, partial [bacterium]|nr:threonine--tRNA ligase [bacterium]